MTAEEVREVTASMEPERSEIEPLIWAEARTRAINTVMRMNHRQIRSVLHGSHFKMAKSKPDAGFYKGNTQAWPDLKIPPLRMMHAGQGYAPTEEFEVGTTTAYPCLLALASTWDENLTYNMAAAVAEEFRGKGANVMLGPSINVLRMARNGRNFESLSGEDPVLGQHLTRSFVKGVQGKGVMAVVKHFAFSAQEAQQGNEDAEIDERTAWELYYPPFIGAVQANVAGVMCAAGRVNGTPSCMNSDLLQRDLKERMYFRGMVMSDWNAVQTEDAFGNGLDQIMPGVAPVELPRRINAAGALLPKKAAPKEVPSSKATPRGKPVKLFETFDTQKAAPKEVPSSKATPRGKPVQLFETFDTQDPREVGLHQAVVRVLTAIYRLRLHEDQGCVPPADCSKIRLSNQKSDEHSDMARQAATDAIVLLKNDGDLLPLRQPDVQKVAVLGSAATAQPSMGNLADYYSGGGSGHVPALGVTTPLEGIRLAAERHRIKVVTEAQGADVCVVVAATTSGEGADRPNLRLDREDEIESAVAQCNKTVVLMQTPGAVLTPWRHDVMAIANLFMGGEETASAWGAVLFGEKTPSGKLPISFPEFEEDTIMASKASGPVAYAERLATSYRSPKFKVAFPFGHGLSYTTFEYLNLKRKVDCPWELCLMLTVRNSGKKYAGREVVQAYFRFDRGDEPPLVLRNFFKTKLLKPGQRDKAWFVFHGPDLAIWKEGSGWKPQPEMTVSFGSSSRDLRANITVFPRV